MIRELVIHIGDPKNGSTSIQKAMQAGACRCETATLAVQPELNASALANSLNPDRGNPERRTKARPRLFGEKARWAQENDADLGIISAEFFSSVDPGALQAALQEFLPDHAASARIIAYVRPHAGRALSGYAQRVKTGAFKGPLDKFVAHLAQAPALYYTPRFAPWQEVFGARFTLRPFIREELRDQDVVSDFFDQALQGAPFALEDVPSTNESLALEELAALRQIQSRFMQLEVPRFLRLSLGAAIGQALAQQPGRYRGKLKLDRANAERLQAAFAADARALDAQFFGRPLMAQALEQAVETAAAQAQTVSAEAYYPPEQLAQLDRLAKEAAALVKDRPQAWRHEYQRRNGQRLDRLEDQPDSAARRKNAEQVWAVLEETAAQMLPAQTRPAG